MSILYIAAFLFFWVLAMSLHDCYIHKKWGKKIDKHQKLIVGLSISGNLVIWGGIYLVNCLSN